MLCHLLTHILPLQEECWIGRLPTADHPNVLKIQSAQAEIRQLRQQILELEHRVAGWEDEMVSAERLGTARSLC